MEVMEVKTKENPACHVGSTDQSGEGSLQFLLAFLGNFPFLEVLGGFSFVPIKTFFFFFATLTESCAGGKTLILEHP